jgi:1,4-alpha-glucan branching enzyme
MKRIHESGVFDVVLPEQRAPIGSRYRLEVVYAADTFTLRDPYAFAPSLGPLDLHLAAEGTHEKLYERLGAHVRTLDGVSGTSFAVWAPEAARVSVTGDFNGWDGRLHAMRRMGQGIWELFIPDVGHGAIYKYEIQTPAGALLLKADPYGRWMELRPNTASRVYVSQHRWTDAAWMERRAASHPNERPVSIYEVHLGSWRRVQQPDGTSRWMTYRELADSLVDHVARLGFTHVELMPVTEHPYDGSWGYQVSGYFAATSRYGTPDDFKYFVDRCHERGIGVLLDWAPAHFPRDAFALARFDGTALYEHLDPRKGEHRQWGTYVFNYARNEVRNFLVSSALYWLDEFHVDGLRVDAVASMLYLDYAAQHPSEWVPNEYGGRENLDAVLFLRQLNDSIHRRFPGAITCAEESTTWPGVTRPTYVGGLGFDFKWNMGWMHDTLDYMKQDPVYRAFHHRLLTFGIMYAFSERFLLPMSHDEVVHLKKSLLSKMPGDRWRQHAQLRTMYSYMWAHPGKKLLFMGGEIGQRGEWNHESELEWSLLNEPDHAGLMRLVGDIQALYKQHAALWEVDDSFDGFRWIDANDSMQSVASFIRFPRQPAPPPPPEPIEQVAKPADSQTGAPATEEPRDEELVQPPAPRHGVHVVFVGNFTPIVRNAYRIGVPRRCAYREVLNTDAKEYGGSGVGNLGRVVSEPVASHGYDQSIVLTLPPLSGLWFVPELAEDPADETATRPAPPTGSAR